MGLIDHQVVLERSAVIDPHHNAASIAQIGDAHSGAEGEGAMGRRQRAPAEALTIGCGAAVEPRPVPACSSLPPRSACWLAEV